MMRTLLLVALFAATACQSGSPAIVEADPAQRAELFGPVAALEGSWNGTHPMSGEATVTEFHVSSNGSVVRELMMKGTEHEMTNMYSLDGNSLVLTHYCAGGNQPRMRATSVDGGQIVFAADGVSDLKERDEVYMAAMTFVILDEDHIEQHWTALKDGEVDHETVTKLERAR